MTAHDEDLREQAELFHFVLQYHPGRYTLAELDRMLNACAPHEEPRKPDVLVRELIAKGVLVQEGSFVAPSLAAVHAGSLVEIF